MMPTSGGLVQGTCGTSSYFPHMGGGALPVRPSQGDSNIQCGDTDAIVPQPHTYPGVQPSKGPHTNPEQVNLDHSS